MPCAVFLTLPCRPVQASAGTAALVAIAAEMNGGGLGPINPALCKIGANPASYANDFHDVTTGNNTADPTVAGYPATTGWDPVTGLGTPDAAKLRPDLVAAVRAGWELRRLGASPPRGS